METSTGISAEQLQAIMAQQAELMKGIVAEAVRAAKELPDDQKADREKAKKQEALAIQQAMDQAKAEEKAKETRQSSCQHKKENGKWATSGQVIGGRYAMLICQRCQKSWMWEPAAEVTAQLLAGDLVLFQAEPPHNAVANKIPMLAVERA